MTNQLTIEKTITKKIDEIERSTYYYLTYDFENNVGEYVRIDYPVIIGEPPEVVTYTFTDIEILERSMHFYLDGEYQGVEYEWAVPKEIWEALLKIRSRIKSEIKKK